MTFFNPKEEVLDIQLTQYGRHLLSKGKMKPVYYAFFDEGVIYDSTHGGFEESKNDAEGRIQEETPSLKPRHCFTGRDEFLFDGIGDTEDREELGIYEKLHILTEPLGTSDLNSTKSPFFSMNFLKGELESSIEYQTGSIRTEKTGSQSATYTSYSQQLLKIPQLEVDIEYKIAVSDPLDRGIRFEIDENLSTGRTYANDMAVYIGAEEILILAEEGNTTCDRENFDIEVFEMTGLTGSLGEEILNPLSFIKPIKMVENNILLDPMEARKIAGQAYGDIVLDDSYVEYYINIDTDKEINRNIICDSLGKIKRQGRTIYSPCGVDLDCPDFEDVIVTDIYDSDSDPDNC
jgi:hypothetical protein